MFPGYNRRKGFSIKDEQFDVRFLMFYFYNSGMYYDEDGDLAEEFYEEVTPVQGTPWMRRITKNLTRQVCSL